MLTWQSALVVTTLLTAGLAAPGLGQDPKGKDMGSKASPSRGSVSKEACDEILAAWPEEARKAAKTAIEKHGPPSEATESMLIWNHNGPWKKTIAYREEVQHDFPMPHKDVLEQVIDYRVPVDMFDDLAAYDGSVVCERTKGEISARCDKEEMNFLAINLAHDVASGKRNVEDARAYYAKAAMAFMKGEKDPYTQGLKTGSAGTAEAGASKKDMGTADPDKPAKM